MLGNNIIIASYLFINLLGISVARQIHINKRKQFELYNNEKELRVEYQNTLDELVTLRGIIPICANCKQIRDDQGYWNQLEAYIQKHSLAKLMKALVVLMIITGVTGTVQAEEVSLKYTLPAN